MAHFYIKSGFGTRTTGGGYASAQSGAFSALGAANVYASVNDARSDGLTDGDIVYLSNSHAESNGSSAIEFGQLTTDNIKYISVDDSNCDQYLPGASVTTTGAVYDPKFNGTLLIAGIDITSGDLIDIGVCECVVFQDLTITTGSDLIDSDSDGNRIVFINVDYDAGSTANAFLLEGGCRFEWYGGSMIGAGVTNLFHSNTGISGGFSAYIYGVNFSNAGYNLFNIGSATGVDNLYAKFVHCKLHASSVIDGGVGNTTPGARIELFNCDTAANDKLYRLHVEDGCGQAINNTATYWTNGLALYEGTDKMSVQVSTNSNTDVHTPFVLDLPLEYVDLSQAANDTVVIHLTSDSALTDADVGAMLMYADGTTAVQANFASSFPSATGSHALDPLASGTTLTTTSGEWTSGKTNTYKLEVSTSGDVGQACAPFIRLLFPKNVANDIFVSSEVEYA